MDPFGGIKGKEKKTLSGFSIDKLMVFLILLNQDIEVNVKAHPTCLKPEDLNSHFSLNYLVL